jgi:hypothetical protein
MMICMLLAAKAAAAAAAARPITAINSTSMHQLVSNI